MINFAKFTISLVLIATVITLGALVVSEAVLTISKYTESVERRANED
jgi:hypothetical protein